MYKRITSILLSISISCGIMPAFAADNDKRRNVEEYYYELAEAECSHVLCPDFDPDATQEPYSNEPVEYTFEVSKEFKALEINKDRKENVSDTDTITEAVYDPERENDQYEKNSEPEDRSVTNDETWSNAMADRFGDAYLAPYKRTAGQRVAGNTNRLVIEETDLSLPGKNGLDLNIRRTYDNQKYSESFYAHDLGPLFANHETARNKRYIYAFTNMSNNITVYIGFVTTDDFYTYMQNGMTVSAMPNRTVMANFPDGNRRSIYYFEDIYNRKATSGILLQYDNSFTSFSTRITYSQSVRYQLAFASTIPGKVSLGNSWELEMPEGTIAADNYRTKTYTTTDKITKLYYFNGTFRDIDGNISTFDGDGQFVKYKDGVTPNKYTSSFGSKNNDFMSYTPVFEGSTVPGTSKWYNFMIFDSRRGLTYYIDNNGMTEDYISSWQSMYVVAVMDRFGNMIKYNYNTGNKLTSIEDTYGRVVSFTIGDTESEVSYMDENGHEQSILYENETLPASQLNNDSPISAKEVQRFKVTNEENETTIYDARDTEIIYYGTSAANTSVNGFNYYYDDDIQNCTGSNIERIIYPTGAETRYRYKRINIHSGSHVAHYTYAVEDSYDIISNTVKNHKTYDFATVAGKINKTETDVTKSAVSIYEYSTKSLLEKATTSATGTTSSIPYVIQTYTYDPDDSQPKSVNVNNSGISKTTYYEYQTWYPSSINYEMLGDKKTTYTYHVIDGKRTGIPSIINVQYKSGYDYVIDYSIQTTLTNDNKAVEYERKIKDSTIKSQKQYVYSSDGRVTAVKEWVKDYNSDGVLDENDSPIVTNLSYNDGTYSNTVTESLSSVTDADGENTGAVSTTYTYTRTGKPYSKTDPKGNITTIEYDGTGRAVRYNYPNGGYESIDYNTASKFTNARDLSGKSVWTYYDGFGMPTTKYFHEGSWKTFESRSYDTSERLTTLKKYTDTDKYIKEKYTYDIFNRVLTKEVYDNATKLYTESYVYSTASGSSIVTKTITAEDATPVAEVKEYYNNLGWLTKREIGTGTDKQTYNYTYDYLGRMLTETDAKGNVTEYQYDIEGNVTMIIYPDDTVQFIHFDMAGRKIIEYDRELTATRYTYDEPGRVTDTKRNMEGSSTAETKRYYDKNSNVIKESVKNNAQGTSGAGSTSPDATYTDTEYAYDSMNNVIGVTTAGGAVQYWYDVANRVTAMSTGLTAIDPNSTAPTDGAITSYTYNKLSYVATETDALNQTATYTYDYAGNAKSITDRNGNVTTNVYGPYGITSSSITDGSDTEMYTYTYNDMGQVTEAKLYSNNTLTDTVTATYDMFGRKLTETNNGRTNSYIYDKNSNLTGYQLNNGAATESSNLYTYDEMNRLTQADLNGIIVSYTYDDMDNITSKTVGNNVTTITYNNMSLPTSYVNTINSTTSESYSYTYSVDGNRLTENDSANNISRSYTYDGNGRLVSEDISGAYDYTKAYTYDLRGNRLTETVTGDDSYVMTNTYDLNNRLTNQVKTVNGTANKVTDIYYDANGNQTLKENYSCSQNGTEDITGGDRTTSTAEVFTYNLRSQLTGYETADTTASYTYGANGLRKNKTVNNTTTGFVWNGGNLAAELSGNSITNLYNYGADGIVSKTTGNTTALYLKDAHGSIVDITDTSGGFVINEPYSYDAFGNIISQDTPDPFGYCGEYRDSESGLIYLRNRYYDSSTGRFITEDNYWNICNMLYGDEENDFINTQDEERNNNDECNDKKNNYHTLCIEKRDLIGFNNNFYRATLHENAIIGSDYPKIQSIGKFLAIERTRIPNIEAIAQSNNLYVYSMNNPTKYIDTQGNVAVADDMVYIAVAAAAAIATAGVIYYKEHTSNKRKSTENKHQKGQTRKLKDAGGEKGDARRTPRKDKRK